MGTGWCQSPAAGIVWVGRSGSYGDGQKEEEKEEGKEEEEEEEGCYLWRGVHDLGGEVVSAAATPATVTAGAVG